MFLIHNWTLGRLVLTPVWLVFICIVHKHYVDLLFNLYRGNLYCPAISIYYKYYAGMQMGSFKQCSGCVWWFRSAVLVNVWRTFLPVMCSYFRRVWRFSGPHQYPVYKCCVFCDLLYVFDQIFILQDVLPFDRHDRKSTMRRNTLLSLHMLHAISHFSSDSPTVTRTKDFQWHTGFLIHDIALLQTLSLNDNIKFILSNFCIINILP